MIKRFCSPDSLDMLRRLSRIHHKNLMEIYDAEIIGGICVALCEYVSGITIEQSVFQRGVYSESEAVGIIVAICSGLSALHKAGIIHRDITPSNIMIDTYGNVKVIDYDISRTVKRNKSKDTAILGTEGYAAPEQFGFHQTDGRADIYSCGVLLNFLLTGKIPQEQFYQGSLTPVISRCISLTPDARYMNAEHLKAALIGDMKYLKLIKDNDYENMRFRPIPGFRSKHIIPKVITVIGILLYVPALLLWLLALTSPPKSRLTLSDYASHAFVTLIVFGCWTLFPYLLFGDIGRYTAKFSSNLYTRKTLSRLFGWMSIIAGILLFILMITLYNHDILEI